jgi:hypothetical protein
LLSLPEFADSMAVESWLAEQGSGDVLPSWPELEHVFTHFRLIITPVPVRLDTLASTRVQDSAGQWLPLAQALEAGLPAPVKRLLQRLTAECGVLVFFFVQPCCPGVKYGFRSAFDGRYPGRCSRPETVAGTDVCSPARGRSQLAGTCL